MPRFIITFFYIITIPCCLSGMEEIEPVVTGGAASVEQADVVALTHHDLKDLSLLMRVIMTGIVVKDHSILLPGREYTLPLERAAPLVNSLIDEAAEATYNGQEIVTSSNPAIRECQMMQKRLWDFVACVDIIESGTENQEYKEQLYRNRMLRIGALVTQNEEILKECGRAPVYVSCAEHKAAVLIDQQSDTLTPEANEEKAGCCCFSTKPWFGRKKGKKDSK